MKSFIAIALLALSLAAESNWTQITDINIVHSLVYVDGQLYAGSDGGLVRFDTADSSYFIYTFQDGRAGAGVSALALDSAGTVWYSSRDGFLGRVSGNSVGVMQEFVSQGIQINDILALGDSALLVATDRGIALVDMQSDFLVGLVREFYYRLGNFSRETEALFIELIDSTIWTGTPAGLACIPLGGAMAVPTEWSNIVTARTPVALARYNDTLIVGLEQRDSAATYYAVIGSTLIPLYDGFDYPVSAMLVKGDTLFAPGSWGIYYYTHSGGWRHFPVDFYPHGFYSIAYGEGTLYFGLNMRGIGWSSDDNDTVKAFRFNSPAGNSPFCAVADAEGSVWVLSYAMGGSYQNASGSWTPYTYWDHRDEFDSEMRYTFYSGRCAVIDRRGVLWVGSKGHGIGKLYPDSSYTVLDTTNSPLHGADDAPYYIWVPDIGMDSLGNIWVIQYNPANRLPVLLYSHDNLDDEPILTIGAESAPIDLSKPTCIALRGGKVWIGLDGEGVLGLDYHGNVLDSTYYTWYYYVADDLPDGYVNDIAIDSKGHIWVATNGGLARIEPEIDMVFPMQMPLNTSLNVIGVAVDKWDNIWLATDNGGAVLSSGSGEFTVFKAYSDISAPAGERSGLISNYIYSVSVIGSDVWFLCEGGISVLQRNISSAEGTITVRVYPNPISFRGNKKVTFASLPANPVLIIYDGGGKMVKSFSATDADYAGRILWDGTNENGAKVASGLYPFITKGENSVGRGTVVVK